MWDNIIIYGKDLITISIIAPILLIVCSLTLIIGYVITTIFGVLITLTIGWKIGPDNFCSENSFWAGCFLRGLIGDAALFIGLLSIIIIICGARRIYNEHTSS